MGNKILCVLLLAVVPGLPASGSDIDYTFMSQRSFSSAAMKGLGDAGVALPGDISSGMWNPALLYSSISGTTGAVAVGYGRDSLFNRHIMPFTAGYVNGNGALGGFYRYQSGDVPLRQNEIALNLSGVMFEKADMKGRVDFGINFRYEWMGLASSGYRRLPVERYIVDSTGNTAYQSTIDSIDMPYRRESGARRFIVDIGFYQPDFLDRLDFGLVLRNLAGYAWEKGRPRRVAADSSAADSVAVAGDTVIRRYSYVNEDAKGWLSKRYRSLLIGIVYRIEAGAALQFSFPVDLELLGLFDRKVENKFVFRGGIAAQIKSMFFFRLGYARQPKTFLEGITPFRNTNFFTGGAGVFISPVSFDFYLSQQSFGITAGYRF